MRRVCASLIVAVVVCGCGGSSASHEGLDAAADGIRAAASDAGPHLQQMGKDLAERLKQAAESEDVHAATKGAICTSLQAYGQSGQRPSPSQFADLMGNAEARYRIHVGPGGGLKIRNAVYQLIAEAQSAANNQSLSPARAEQVIAGEVGCTADNILPMFR